MDKFKVDLVKKHPESKMVLSLFGRTPTLVIHDFDMAEELLRAVPEKMDRSKSTYINGVLFSLTKSMFIPPTSAILKQRRNMIMTHLGLKTASRNIPMII